MAPTSITAEALADQRASLEREIADLEENLREKHAELAAVGS